MSYTENKQGIPVIHMRPSAQLDYPMEWAKRLKGDDIASYSVDVPSGIKKTSVMLDGTVVVGWFESGPAHAQHRIRYNITTNSSPPRKDSQEIILDVRP